LAGVVRANVEVWRGRATEALKQLAEFELTDKTKLAAIGYCFGGTTCIQLAAAGADLKAIATFHSALPKLSAKDAAAIKAAVQINHGADDTFISAESIKGFKSALSEAKVNLDFLEYPGCVHSFTVPGADERNLPGMKYDKKADEASWAAMKKLFDKAFK
jgi:dienelactone hydrolase